MKKASISLGAVLGSLVALPGAALAHPDHWTSGGYGLAHLFTDPFHLAMAAGAVAAFAGVYRVVRRRQAAERRASR
jgi:hypothetical protein